MTSPPPSSKHTRTTLQTLRKRRRRRRLIQASPSPPRRTHLFRPSLFHFHFTFPYQLDLVWLGFAWTGGWKDGRKEGRKDTRPSPKAKHTPSHPKNAPFLILAHIMFSFLTSTRPNQTHSSPRVRGKGGYERFGRVVANSLITSGSRLT